MVSETCYGALEIVGSTTTAATAAAAAAAATATVLLLVSDFCDEVLHSAAWRSSQW